VAKKIQHKRVLLKVSGEALLGDGKSSIDPKAVIALAEQICAVQKLHVEIAVVIGGGNIIRGSQAHALDIPREQVDQMGMLATTINGMMLAATLARLGCTAALASAFSCGTFIPQASGDEAIGLLQSGIVMIFVGGTGHPYFTTDTAAALRACEIQADILIKATKVDGIFDKDPIKHPKAKQLSQITYNDVLCSGLNVMDAAAIALCRDNKIPIRVLNIFKKEALKAAIQGQNVGSLVTGA
jgi:uridylate kinase